MEKLKVLDLFSGIGGFSLGLERTGGFETVAFCEIEEFPRKVLAKHWPDIQCFPDVTKLKGSDVGSVDVICGGYPCQPFSTAGKRRGKEDNRHLWPEFMRLVVELRPTWVIGENVAGHVSMGLDDVLSDLEREDYTCRTFIIPACAKDAKHRRDRVWTVAYSAPERHGEGRKAGNILEADGGQDGQMFGKSRSSSAKSETLAHTKGQQCPSCDNRHEQGKIGAAGEIELRGGDSWPLRGYDWPVEPDVGQLVNGVSARLVGGCVDADEGWIKASRQKNAEGMLRGLRLYKDALRSSHKWRLDGQQSIECQDALFFLSHVTASQAGRPSREDTKAALHGLWEAILSRKSVTLQYAPDEIKTIWKSITEEEKDWCILAACLGCFWSEWSGVTRVATGVPNRVDRLKGLGNAVVPQIPEMIGYAILEAEKEAT